LQTTKVRIRVRRPRHQQLLMVQVRGPWRNSATASSSYHQLSTTAPSNHMEAHHLTNHRIPSSHGHTHHLVNSPNPLSHPLPPNPLYSLCRAHPPPNPPSSSHNFLKKLARSYGHTPTSSINRGIAADNQHNKRPHTFTTTELVLISFVTSALRTSA